MDNKKTLTWIDGVIQDLTDPAKSLEDCLRKTLVLAYSLKNDKLKSWVESELNSYEISEPVPTYRKVRVEIWGNVAAGLQRATNRIHFQGAEHAYFEALRSGLDLRDNVAGLESIVQQQGKSGSAALKFTLSPYLHEPLEALYPGWHIEDAWMVASAFTITGVLSQIKTSLLQFLLSLNEELGNENNFSIMNNSEKVDRIIEHTIGVVHAENVTFGVNYQTKGDQNTVVQGNYNSQQITSPDSLLTNIKTLTDQIKELLDKEVQLEPDVKEEISYQLAAVERQANKEKPKLDLISKSLQIIETLLMDSASSVYVPLILEGIRHLLPQLAK
jgi:hypothetical protein